MKVRFSSSVNGVSTLLVQSPIGIFNEVRTKLRSSRKFSRLAVSGRLTLNRLFPFWEEGRWRWHKMDDGFVDLESWHDRHFFSRQRWVNFSNRIIVSFGHHYFRDMNLRFLRSHFRCCRSQNCRFKRGIY